MLRTMTRVWGLLLACAFLAQGCAHYRMGAGPAPSFATLYIEPSKNKTTVPQSQALVSTMLREAFIRDGRVEVVDSSADADATLEVTLVKYRRDNAANREDDVGLARKFTIKLTASCNLRDNRTGRMLFDGRLVEVQREAFTDNGLSSVPFGTSNDQLQSEYNTLPLLADALCDQVTHTVLDVW
jgi:Lipopolysaccharide-assembly